MRTRKLKTLCRKWQKQLRLSDWDISIRFAEPDELSKDTQGEIDITHELKQASILVLKPKAHQRMFESKQDTEGVVIHELLHIHMDSFSRDLDSLRSELQEQAIESIVKALQGV